MTGIATSSGLIGDALAERLARFPQPNPVAAPLIASDALKCARRIGFRLFGTVPDIPLTQAERARFEDGDHIDAIVSETVARELDGRIQVPFNWLPGAPLKGKADAGYRSADGRKVILEAKSASQKAFARAIGMYESVPAAPKVEWLLQGGLAACSPVIDAPLVHVVLVDNESLTPPRKPQVAEWLVDVDASVELQDAPERGAATVRQLVEAEVARQVLILSACEGGTLPPRDVPGYGIVANPPAKDEYGDPWQCRWCPFQPTCSKLGPGPVDDFGEVAA